MRRAPLITVVFCTLACSGLLENPAEITNSDTSTLVEEQTKISEDEVVEVTPQTGVVGKLQGTWRFSAKGTDQRRIAIIEAAVTGRERLRSALQPLSEEEAAFFAEVKQQRSHPSLIRLSQFPKGANVVIASRTLTLTTRKDEFIAELSPTEEPNQVDLQFNDDTERWVLSFPDAFTAKVELASPAPVSFTLKRM